MKLVSLTRERKREKKAKIDETTRQNNDGWKMGSRKGSAKCKPIVMGKNQTLRDEKFCFNFGSTNLMTYESRDEKGLVPAKRKTERNVMRKEESKPYCSSRSRSCMVATNLPLRWQAQGFTVGVAESNSE